MLILRHGQGNPIGGQRSVESSKAQALRRRIWGLEVVIGDRRSFGMLVARGCHQA
jgi:hypothetical protein